MSPHEITRTFRTLGTLSRSNSLDKLDEADFSLPAENQNRVQEERFDIALAEPVPFDDSAYIIPERFRSPSASRSPTRAVSCSSQSFRSPPHSPSHSPTRSRGYSEIADSRSPSRSPTRSKGYTDAALRSRARRRSMESPPSSPTSSARPSRRRAYSREEGAISGLSPRRQQRLHSISIPDHLAPQFRLQSSLDSPGLSRLRSAGNRLQSLMDSPQAGFDSPMSMPSTRRAGEDSWLGQGEEAAEGAARKGSGGLFANIWKVESEFERWMLCALLLAFVLTSAGILAMHEPNLRHPSARRSIRLL